MTMMMVARWVKGNKCFMVSCSKICRSLKWDLPSQQVMKETMKLAQSLLTICQPKQILRQIRMPRTNQRAKTKIKYKRKHEKYDKNLITQMIKIYNAVPDKMKDLPRNKFKLELKKI